jgi:hypothetical protein
MQKKTVNSKAAIAQDVVFSGLVGVLGDAGEQKKSPADERGNSTASLGETVEEEIQTHV